MGSTLSPTWERAITCASIAAWAAVSYIYVVYFEDLSNGHCGTFRDIPGHRQPWVTWTSPKPRIGDWIRGKRSQLSFAGTSAPSSAGRRIADLPVHRLQDSPKGRVYAFTDELSRWMKSPASAEVSGQEQEDSERRTCGRQATPVARTSASIQPDQRGRISAVALPTRSARHGNDGCSEHWRWLACLGIAGGFWYYRQASLHAAQRDPSAAKPLAGHNANPEAQDFYLRGRYEWDKRTPESLNKAVDYFTQAIVRDPNYAQAYVGLADCYNLLREFSAMPPDEAYPRALAAAKKAVELDDSSAEAHTSLAFATFYGTFNAAGAEREFKRAIELNPNYAKAHHWYATFPVRRRTISGGSKPNRISPAT